MILGWHFNSRDAGSLLTRTDMFKRFKGFKRFKEVQEVHRVHKVHKVHRVQRFENALTLNPEPLLNLVNPMNP